MRTQPERYRWRYSLRSLLLAIVGLSIFLAATLATGKPRVMFRFDDADGGNVVYAHHYGWPVTYLRVPSGQYAGEIPPDLFAPGLIVDLGVAGGLFVATLFVAAVLKRAVRLATREDIDVSRQYSHDEPEDGRQSHADKRQS